MVALVLSELDRKAVPNDVCDTFGSYSIYDVTIQNPLSTAPQTRSQRLLNCHFVAVCGVWGGDLFVTAPIIDHFEI